MEESDFVKHFVDNASQIMWFLGAGTSRSANMPTANDLIWDLKLKYYCLQENQDIKQHDITNETIKTRIQSYMDSKGFPAIWSPEEYSFYFELNFGTDYSAQQKYLVEKLSNSKVSLNTGHRALAGLIALNKARVIFTTNFDEVIETAHVKVAEATLPTYHLEGSYAALEALNNERYPIYAKIHGDFRYQSIKNLASDLISNDNEIKRCFLASSTRYGLIVTGYSGRDENVMQMFYDAIDQNNAFPSGFLWTVTDLKKVDQKVKDIITKAKTKGINANIIETGTFDSMLSKIWRQIPDKTSEIDKKVRTAMARNVNIPLPAFGNEYPVIRTNAIPIISLPETCAIINTNVPLASTDLKDLFVQNKGNAIISRLDNIVGWGNEIEFKKILGSNLIDTVKKHKFENPIKLIGQSKGYHSFFERALAYALCANKPLRLKNDKGFVLVVNHKQINDPIFNELKLAIGYKGQSGPLTGLVSGSHNTYWAEAISIKIEHRNDKIWLMIKPIFWIEPNSERQNHTEFMKNKRRYRYNSVSNSILTAWINILFGSVGSGNNVELIAYTDSEHPAKFTINTRTSYSRK